MVHGEDRHGSNVVAKAILNNEEIDVFNHGLMKRDFTYIDDISEVVQNVVTSLLHR